MKADLQIVYSTTGELVSAFVIIDACNFEGILQIQLIQQSKICYTLKLNVSKTFTKLEELLASFKTYLGNDAIINIEYVEEIPVLASGKQKITVNNYIKTNEMEPTSIKTET